MILSFLILELLKIYLKLKFEYKFFINEYLADKSSTLLFKSPEKTLKEAEFVSLFSNKDNLPPSVIEK